MKAERYVPESLIVELIDVLRFTMQCSECVDDCMFGLEGFEDDIKKYLENDSQA